MSQAVGYELETAWHLFAADLRRFIGRRVSTPEDADDIVQSVFLRLAGNATPVQEDRVAAWLYATTRNAITDYYRSAVRRREVPVGEFPGAEPLSSDEDENTAEAELGRCLLPMVDRLPFEQAEAIRMVDLGGMSQADAAARMQVSVSGMKSRVQRGRGRLRELLAQCCEVHRDARGRVYDYGCAAPDGRAGTAPGCAAC